MFKNVASQSVMLFAFDTTSGAAKTGDAANMLFYVTKDFGTVTAIAANSAVPTEVDSTNAKGWYKIALSQSETNADNLQFTGKSSTSNISVVGRPVDTFPASFTSSVAQTGDSFARLGAPAGASVSADVAAVKTDTAAVKVQTDKLAFTVANQVDSNVIDWKSATAPAMTGDAFARLGAPAGASVSADVAAIKSDTGTILTDVNSGAGAIYTRIGAPAGASIAADIAALPTATVNADALLNRDMSTGTDTGSTTVRTVRQALRFLRNKWAISAGTLTVFKEDDATSSWTSTVTTDPAALPIVSTDPAGP